MVGTIVATYFAVLLHVTDALVDIVLSLLMSAPISCICCQTLEQVYIVKQHYMGNMDYFS